MITHVQLAPFGYPYGKPGLSMVPFLPFNVPPQLVIKPVRERSSIVNQIIIDRSNH